MSSDYDRIYRSITSNPDKLLALKAHATFLAGNCQGSVLDLGCGLSFLCNMIKKSQYFGVDFSQVAINWSKLYNKNPNATFACEDICNISIKARYRTVVLSEILEHLEDPKAVVERAKKICTSILIVTLPVDIQIREHVKGTWTKDEILDLVDARVLKLSQGCVNRKGYPIHWHCVFSVK